MAAESTKKSRKKTKSKNEDGGLLGPLSGILTYLREVRTELYKVSWPTRPDVIRMTRIVLITTIAFALALGGLSLLLSRYIAFGVGGNEWIFAVTFVIVVAATVWKLRDSSSGGYK